MTALVSGMGEDGGREHLNIRASEQEHSIRHWYTALPPPRPASMLPHRPCTPPPLRRGLPGEASQATHEKRVMVLERALEPRVTPITHVTPHPPPPQAWPPRRGQPGHP